MYRFSVPQTVVFAAKAPLVRIRSMWAMVSVRSTILLAFSYVVYETRSPVFSSTPARSGERARGSAASSSLSLKTSMSMHRYGTILSKWLVNTSDS